MDFKNWTSKASDCSVKHIGSLSYTEDDILIYKLYIAPPLKKKDENGLKKYFSTFGDVESVDIITRWSDTNGSRHFFSFGFVCFKEPESASKALKCKIHTFCNRILVVRSADSWKQPTKKILQKPEDELDNEDSNLNYSILNLNDDCLFMIFKYLSFNEQIKMSSLCTRLEYIFNLLYKTTKSLNIDLADSLTLMDFREGLRKMGDQIENITFNSGLSMKNFTRFIDCVSNFCPNLCKLQLDSLHFKYSQIFHKISTKLQTIRHLELKNCSINDDMTRLLSNISTIEYLDLTENYEVTGSYLEKFENLKTLILNSCANIQSSFFIKMCYKTTKLRELNIRRCDRLNTLAFNALVKNLNELETLTICTCYQTNELEQITQLKKLKHLIINHSNTSTESLFHKLAEDKKDQLETLKVTNFYYNEVAGDSIIKLIKLKQLDLPFASCCTDKFIEDFSKLQDLKILNIPGVFLNIDCLMKYLKKSPNIEFIDLSKGKDYNDEFIKNVIKILQKQNRTHPLTLRVGSTDVSSNIKEETFIEENKNIIKIDTNPTDYVMEMFDSNFDLIPDSDDDYDDINDIDDDFSDDDSDYTDDDCFDYEYDSDLYMNVLDELDNGLLYTPNVIYPKRF